MKKLFLSMSVLASSLMFGQFFNLTPNNFVSVENQKNDYIVLEFPNETQKELFIKTKEFIYSHFSRLKGDGYNDVEYSMIKLRYSSDVSIGNVLGIPAFGEMTTVFEIKFRDEKLMIQPTFVKIEKRDRYGTEIKLTGGNQLLGKSIFNKKGEVWMDDTYQSVKSEINLFVGALQKELNKKEEW